MNILSKKLDIFHPVFDSLQILFWFDPFLGEAAQISRVIKHFHPIPLSKARVGTFVKVAGWESHRIFYLDHNVYMCATHKMKIMCITRYATSDKSPLVSPISGKSCVWYSYTITHSWKEKKYHADGKVGIYFWILAKYVCACTPKCLHKSTSQNKFIIDWNKAYEITQSENFGSETRGIGRNLALLAF